ncbi:MAG: MaoC family dehydratase [Spirochaetes bacterium]|jgi:hypothetical protein|nr:MaoC family dehydratase [Spirochaetota bacterium]
MNDMTVMPYSRVPSLAALLMKALIARKPGLEENMSLSKIERSITGVRIRPESFNAFNKMFGFGNTGRIPLPYYYVLAQRVQLALLTDPAFPLGIPGLVHIDNTFRQFTPAPAESLFDMMCRIDGAEPSPSGRVIEITTDFFINGARAVECRSRFLHRNRKHLTVKNPKITAQPIEGERKILDLQANAGRRYARVSGDFNPFHLHALTARPFGFKHPIAHGIYMLALVDSALEEILPFEVKELNVEYKRPVYLPSQVELIYCLSKGNKSCLFEVRGARSGAEEKLHMKGSFFSGVNDADSCHC